jgi:RNA polymerase sigma-70 factor, ECF subfamily
MSEGAAIVERPTDPSVLFADEGPRLWRSILAYAHDPDIADDAVAEAFAQCLRRGDAIVDPRAWLWRSSFRIAAGLLRDRARWVGEPVDRPYEMPEAPERLLLALRRLPARQRACLVLHHYAGYGTDEIAVILEVSRPTVRVHLSRGRRRLRELLEVPDDRP